MSASLFIPCLNDTLFSQTNPTQTCCGQMHLNAGLELLELTDTDAYCSFGGTFAVKNAETSSAMLSDKIAHVRVFRATPDHGASGFLGAG